MTETPPATPSQDLQVSHGETSPSTPLLETDYEAIAGAVMETERGRWFLQEYAKRNRNTDTQTVLTAIEKLEKRINDDASAPKEATSVALLSHDLIDLVGAISQVKKEVAELGGQGADPDHFNSATIELEAIVEQAESATSEILEAAEKIQEVAFTLREEGASETQCDIIETKIVDIYTACSFQDLTGQRSNKVVQLVGYVERRIASMMSILGLSDEENSSDSEAQPNKETKGASATGLTPQQRNDQRPDADLLNGPAITGEGNEQGDVDALFDDVAFNDEPGFGADACEPLTSDLSPPDADDEAAEASDPDQLDLAEDHGPASVEIDETVQGVETDIEAADVFVAEVADEDLANDEDFAPIVQDDEDEDDEKVSEASVEPADEDEAAPKAEKADYGADEEEANTPEAADVFGFDVYGDAQLVELHDAEILSQPAEDALLKSALTTQPQEPSQDIFDVEPLSFDGDDFGQSEESEHDDELEAGTDGAPKMVVGLPGDFNVDSNVADMFVGSEGDDTQSSAAAELTSDDDSQELVDGQDIFEAEAVDASTSDTDANSIENSNGAFDEKAVDDAFASLEAEAAIEAEENIDHQSADTSADIDEDAVDLEIADPTVTESSDNDTAAAEELMEQALTATMVTPKKAEYPDDEYTSEERIALFS